MPAKQKALGDTGHCNLQPSDWSITVMNLPKHKRNLLDNVIDELKRIARVKAIVLGGSYATGMATDSSDLDIGIYYSAQSPFDLEKIKMVAEKFAGKETPIVTGFYECGPWVNVGAWIKTTNGKVDFLRSGSDFGSS